MSLLPIHPFPARMAPDLARLSFVTVPAGGRVLDPMCGSGTVARSAVEEGFNCVGIDIDPLAVLMARVWTTHVDPSLLADEATRLIQSAKSLAGDNIDQVDEPNTKRFISYWFAPQQRNQLSRLTTVLSKQAEPMKSILTIGLSRIIISKEMRAFLARDTSHSRPHRVADTNDFDIYGGFLRSVNQVAARIRSELIKGTADIRLGDARTLVGVDDDSFDLALTSPPYLNAIDYLRGHRLTLVWLGWDVNELKGTRSISVGAERSMPESEAAVDISSFVEEQQHSNFTFRHMGWIRRYASDMDAVLRELGRVVKTNGKVILVLGNSFLRGATVNNARLIETLAMDIGFQIQDRHVREIPARRRYLPPPGDGQNALDVRMRTETVLTCVV